MMPVEYQQNGRPEAEEKEYLLKMVGISKSFPGVRALKSVDFDLKRGEVHVLAGENGAGKSTLNKVLSGVYDPEAGEIYLNGNKTLIKNPRNARLLGIGTVYQELSLVPHMTVLENLFLGLELNKGPVLDKTEMRKQAQRAIDSVGFPIDLDASIHQIDIAHRQMVEIARHFIKEIQILILDEPTSALTKEEIDKLFAIVNKLKKGGVGIIYISHRLNELEYIGDRVSILRDGENVATIGVDKASEDYLIELMTGRKVEKIFPKVDSKPGEVLLEVEDLSTEKGLNNVSFKLHAGEILGVGGLIGSGKENLARAVFGLDKLTAGKIKLKGKALRKVDPSVMIRKGIVYIPADRRTEGILLLMTIRENITMPSLDLFTRSGILKKKDERKTASELGKKLDIKAPTLEVIVQKLSGGNQQKVIVARALVRDTKVFIFHELTRGIDVGTKIEIYKFLQELAKQGAGILFVSSEMVELLHVTHRVAVTREDRIAEVFETPAIDEEVLLRSYFGVVGDRKENSTRG
jgi:ribose transport system ATP-binding protein